MDSERTSAQAATTVSVRITNGRTELITFYLEPWGESYPMPPRESFEVRVTGPGSGTLEVEFAEDHATVWAWAGSVARVFHGAQELGVGDWGRQRVPPVPDAGAAADEPR